VSACWISADGLLFLPPSMGSSELQALEAFETWFLNMVANVVKAKMVSSPIV
jgi:hypothetical protein